MGWFKKEKNSEIKENNSPRLFPIKLSNGLSIEIISVEKDRVVQHSDGRKSVIHVIGISNPYIPGQVMVMEPAKYIAVEVEENQKIDNEFIRTMMARYFAMGINKEGCQYVGEYNSQYKQFDKYSKSVENYVRSTLNVKLQNRINEKKYQKSLEIYVNSKKEIQNWRDNLIKNAQKYKDNLDRVKEDRISRPYLESKGYVNVFGKTVANYNGINTQTGEILKIRHLDKVGKDGNGTYLYTGYIQNVMDKDKNEVLGEARPRGTFVCFEMRKRFEDIVNSGNLQQIKQLLNFFSTSGIRGYEKDGLYYIGKMDEYGNISRNANSNSPAIRNAIEGIKREYAQTMKINKDQGKYY